MVIVAATVGLASAALGAFIAVKSFKREEPVPVTPVGLLEDPAPVHPEETTLNDAGVVVATRPGLRRTNNLGARSSTETAPSTPSASSPSPATTPTTPAATTPVRPPNVTPTGRPTLRTDESGNVVEYGADGRPVRVLPQAPRDAGSPTTATAQDASAGAGGSSTNVASNTNPPAENGVIERGPRSSVGGYRMGDETDATGHMEDPHVFTFVYRHYASQIAACHSTASRNRSVSGITVVRVRIGQDGHVSRTRVISDSTHDAELQACVQNAIRGWRYPQPIDGDVEVDYPLRFGSRTQ
jgi:TonB family protein